jgi:nucleoside-diphosphate-sugar epimerase
MPAAAAGTAGLSGWPDGIDSESALNGLLLLLMSCRNRPVCIPTPGVQLVTLTHVEDVAAMLAAVPGNPAAIRQYYNVCSDRQISHTGMAS